MMLTPLGALAQQDTTPPVLVSFSATPVAFDAALSSVSVSFCLKAVDNVSATYLAGLGAFDSAGNSLFAFPSMDHLDYVILSSGQQGCRIESVPQFKAYGQYGIWVRLIDGVGNTADWRAGAPLDLCAIGPCRLDNRSAVSGNDADGDGVPDDLDACPYDAANDADHDGICGGIDCSASLAFDFACLKLRASGGNVASVADQGYSLPDTTYRGFVYPDTADQCRGSATGGPDPLRDIGAYERGARVCSLAVPPP